MNYLFVIYTLALFYPSTISFRHCSLKIANRQGLNEGVHIFDASSGISSGLAAFCFWHVSVPYLVL